MLSIDPSEIPVPQLHAYLLGAVGPRPIAFASTVDKDGIPNLAPFSFFNVFSSRPPLLIFSPNRSGRTGDTKQTHENVKEVPEVVINIVNYNMVHQMSLTSSPYAKGVDEFIKSGLTKVASEKVKPFRVAESPVQLECKVLEVKELGTAGGAGNLIICEVVKMHINEEVLDEKGVIDQQKIDLVARMGGNWYCRASGDALFEVQKPVTTLGLGVDMLPEAIRNSKVLTGNDLGQLGNLEQAPTEEEVETFRKELRSFGDEITFHQKIKEYIGKEQIKEAWMLMLSQSTVNK